MEYLKTYSSDTSIAVLAGGLSKRMGQDKRFVPLKGKPLIAHTLERLQTLGLPMILIANQPELFASFPVTTYGDVLPEKGSLIGLHSALFHSSTTYTLCVACDMPLLDGDLLKYLLGLRAGFEAVVPCPAQRTEPLHAVYHRDCLPIVKAQIRQGDMRISRLYEQLHARFVTDAEIRQIDPDLRSFTNANTPEELAAIEALL